MALAAGSARHSAGRTAGQPQLPHAAVPSARAPRPAPRRAPAAAAALRGPVSSISSSSGRSPAPAAPAPLRPRARPAPRRPPPAAAAAPAAAPLPPAVDAVVVGAGLAGLHCAALLQARGLEVALLEAGDGPGGRVRTDAVGGFLLDRGFQIFLTGYPYSRAALDFDALRLRPFYAGARVRFQGGWHTVADPLRHFVDGVLSLANPIGSVFDKVNVGVFRLKSTLGSLDDVFAQPETTIEARLRAEGFSEAIIDRFFRPFLGGIFFDTRLGTSSRLFSFVMRMLATGQNCLPEGGIGAVSEQLAAKLAPGSLHLNARVAAIEPGGGGAGARVSLADGRSVEARRGVVVATEGPEAQRLLGAALKASPSKPEGGVGTCCLYFRAPSPPSPDNVLYLNGDGTGIVNNACFPSTVSPTYAPAGQALASVSVIGTHPELDDAALEAAVRAEVSAWFGGAAVSSWTHLRTYRIPFAQPSQAPPTNFKRPVALGGGVFVCGDHRDSATFEGALVSGRRAAEALLAAQGAGK
ncbi:hypothetical protein Rsub_07132 [Raphidocelis subcapitata]|uniref:Amine oxidase domain-containing protein n=1 Tax=Raphidocelis subcapitata TaxID=307507 RepID=A0A2V0PAL7_9CHLO|nr:hypothetical protein Rsub_07132 [Raphidocelis subcapitata]|eukprot:GBF94145.1 hypothetical protein Rsub_07132 [Raphidocelis subcapitata]